MISLVEMVVVRPPFELGEHHNDTPRVFRTKAIKSMTVRFLGLLTGWRYSGLKFPQPPENAIFSVGGNLNRTGAS